MPKATNSKPILNEKTFPTLSKRMNLRHQRLKTNAKKGLVLGIRRTSKIATKVMMPKKTKLKI